MTLKIGKLYCVRENPLAYYRSMMRIGRIGWIDTSVPFLLIRIEEQFYQIVYGDQKVWIDVIAGNPLTEFV